MTEQLSDEARRTLAGRNEGDLLGGVPAAVKRELLSCGYARYPDGGGYPRLIVITEMGASVGAMHV